MIPLRISVGKQGDPLNRQFAQLERNLRKAIKQIEGATLEGMQAAMEEIFDTSQVYVPVDTGDLALSGFVQIDTTVKHPRVIIGYAARGNPHYAIIVHEDLTKNHAPPTRAKFLEAALQEHAGDILPTIAKHARRVLK